MMSGTVFGVCEIEIDHTYGWLWSFFFSPPFQDAFEKSVAKIIRFLFSIFPFFVFVLFVWFVCFCFFLAPSGLN